MVTAKQQRSNNSITSARDFYDMKIINNNL